MKEWAPLLILIFPLMMVISMVARGTCFFRHQKKKYVACCVVDTYIDGLAIRCYCNYANHKYKARWVCENCSKMGEHCVKGWGDWTVSQGVLVPDEKKLANWGGRK